VIHKDLLCRVIVIRSLYRHFIIVHLKVLVTDILLGIHRLFIYKMGILTGC